MGGAGKFQLTPIRGEDKVQGGQFQHTLHTRHGQTAEADLRWLKKNIYEHMIVTTSLHRTAETHAGQITRQFTNKFKICTR